MLRGVLVVVSCGLLIGSSLWLAVRDVTAPAATRVDGVADEGGEVPIGRILGHLVGDPEDVAAAVVSVMRLTHGRNGSIGISEEAMAHVTDGRFVARVRPGTYVLRIEARRKGRTVYAATSPMVVEPDGVARREISLRGETMVTGSVKWDDGAPAAGMLLLALPRIAGRLSCTVVTGDDGTFEIEGFMDGVEADHCIHVTCTTKPHGATFRPLRTGPRSLPWSERLEFVLER